MHNKEEMRQMIQNEIQTISNLEERIIFKELMEGVFLSLYETNERMYEELEHRITDELPYDVNRYLIRTGVVEKQYLDRSHHLMRPMNEQDLNEKNYKLSEMIDAVKEKGEYHLMTVMVQCDYLQLKDIWDNRQQFKGTMETSQIWDLTVELRPNTDYLNHISHLYQLFVRNGIPWQTVNAPYLYKMADVVLVGLPEGIKRNEELKKFQIDFGKYASFIRYDYIPVWNVQRITLETVGFPTPCEDHKNYEYILSIREYGEEHAYLIDDNSRIQSVTQRGKRVSVISSKDETKKWQIYMITNGASKKIDRYTYPMMQNLRTEDFVEKYQRQWGQIMKTKTELQRFIKGFGLDDFAEYQSCEIRQESDGIIQTYNMNAFIEDELRDRIGAKKLILYFKAGKKENWLVRDIASFISSEIQRIFPEYECGGVVS